MKVVLIRNNHEFLLEILYFLRDTSSMKSNENESYWIIEIYLLYGFPNFHWISKTVDSIRHGDTSSIKWVRLFVCCCIVTVLEDLFLLLHLLLPKVIINNC